MQDAGSILPKFLNTDKSYTASDPKDMLSPEESPFLKGIDWDVNSNPEQGIGTNNPSANGQNMEVLTPSQSNATIDDIELPSTGWNKNIGTFESTITKELYLFNCNSLGNHGIYVVSGDTGLAQTVIIDSKLAFTDDPEGFLFNKVGLRIVKDKDGNIIEKHLFWTSGKKWQGWVNVVAAIATNGFDAGLFPYWALLQPHFDREELLEWPVRPIMIKPIVETVDNTAEDIGKINRLVDRAFQFAVSNENTDLRTGTLSPYSLPLLVKQEEFLNDTNNLPKNAKLTLYAGSPLTEKILIYVRKSDSKSLDSTAVWGDWILYDTIEKFDTQPTGAYWTRTNAWANYNYDPIFNTIEYNFDNSKAGKIISAQDALRLQTGMPQISQALTDVDDAVLLSNNRYNYNNFSKTLLDKITAQVIEKDNPVCSVPLRNVRLYAYIARPGNQFSYISQVGYYKGADTQMRFGGLITGRDNRVGIDFAESEHFKLDFADKDAFTCYFKGTPYSAVGKWFQVNSDNSLFELPDLLDASSADVQEYIQGVFVDRGYFVCVFDLKVPAGRYNATIGRHNVASSGNYRGTSTYIKGIANSRDKESQTLPNVNGDVTITTIKNLVSFSKEMEIDCTAGDVDVWGNNKDLFYIYCPDYEGGTRTWRFTEGYFKESKDTLKSVEMFPYRMFDGGRDVTDDCGTFTDKNGFYWAKTRVQGSDRSDIKFIAKLNCAYPERFNIPTSQAGGGWRVNAVSYLSDNNSGVIGDCNRILVKGRITNIGGTIGYSNIAVSIVDGETVYTDSNGDFTLIVHNGQSTLRTSNIYINAGGNFLITVANCGQIPLNVFSEPACVDCNVREFFPSINLQIEIQNNSQFSLKEGGKYPIGLVGADLAGRLTYVNVFSNKEVPTFLSRGNINATFFRMLISGALNLLTENPDIKWVSPYVGKNTNNKRYVEWVGDELIYLDNNGNEVSDPSVASFVKIVVDSLFERNISSNFSLLSSYQFVKNDRLRVLDDGDGNLFDVATFGDPIDVQILGTNYNQAAINAGLLLPQTNTVLDNNNNPDSTEIGLIVKYDGRLDKLKDKTGFWIEIYTPVQENEVIPFFEVAGFYPLIGGEIATFTGFAGGIPTYDFPTSIDIDFWDTYYIQRSISGKFFNHPFESPNVTDNWGANITSGGRLNVENKNAKQVWLGGDVARSDAFMKNGFINGLATFRDENRKNYGIYPFGEICLMYTRRNIIFFGCMNDYFTADYNMPYARVRDGQLVVTNLDENLSLPHQKTGAMFGIEKKDTGTFVTSDDFLFWYDRKNTAFVKSNFQSAIDITERSESERGGLQSYLNAKTAFINKWDNEHDSKDRFDVIGGIDAEHGRAYFTFRPRRNNTNNLSSYVNRRRNLDLAHQETFVYSIEDSGWIACANFTPEAYGRLRGAWANVEFFTFGAGKPYYHNNIPDDSFLNYYGQQCEPCFIGVANKTPDAVKILQAISQNINGSQFFADQIYDTQTNSFSYIPANLWKQKEKMFYAEVLRNMMSYPPVNSEEIFRSMLFDGKRIFGNYMVCRFVQKYEDLGNYFQLSAINYLFTNSATTKP